jgi:putative acetyltransferase
MRPYTSSDEPAVTELWRLTWQFAYPNIDFDSRLDWWRERWRREIVPVAKIVVADLDGEVIGFVTIDPRKGYLDQIVVTPKAWGLRLGAALMAEAKRLSPGAIYLHVNQDNRRAIRFYEKHGFVMAGEDVNRRSGAKVYAMVWKGAQTPSN